MKDTIWVFRSFGWKAGLRYVFFRLWSKGCKRFSQNMAPPKFEDLSDEQAEDMARVSGLVGWQQGNRQDLNRVWETFQKTLN